MNGITIALLILVYSHSVLFAQSEPLVAYRIGDIWYFIDSDNKPMIKPQKLSEFGGFREGYFRVKTEINGKQRWAFMDKKGKLMTVPKAHLLMDFSEGMAITIKFLDSIGEKRLYGFINDKGKQVIPMIYLDATWFREGLAYVMNKEKRGYINKKGEFEIVLQNLVGYPFSEGVAAISDAKFQVGYIDKNGEKVTEIEYDEPSDCSEGLLRVYKDGYFGFLNCDGSPRIDHIFQNALDFKDSMAWVGIIHEYYMTLWALINLDGEMITNHKFIEVTNFSEGLAAVRESDLWGFIDRNGNYVIEPQFTSAAPFVNGIAWAANSKEDVYGFINKKGEYVIKIPKANSVFDLRLNRVVM